jgi:hypothetical protein
MDSEKVVEGKPGAIGVPSFPYFLLKALVRRVMRRSPVRIERFCRSTCDVQIFALSGLPNTRYRFRFYYLSQAVAPLSLCVLCVRIDEHPAVHAITECRFD